jgi:hypothetical protein
MRTTLTIEEDVARQIRKRMVEEKLSLKQVVNDALRVGLTKNARKEKTVLFKVEPHSFGFKAGIDRDKLGQLLDELEVEEFARKYGQ